MQLAFQRFHRRLLTSSVYRKAASPPVSGYILQRVYWVEASILVPGKQAPSVLVYLMFHMNDIDSDLTEADGQFFLGLYRCAVNEYQPKIEKRTGVQLGEITVKEFRQVDVDKMQYLEGWKHSWTTRLFRRSAIKSRLNEWRDYLDSTHSERADSCMACYFRNAIYVSFSKGTRSHEYGLAFTAVHELTHVLWERIAERPLFPRPKGTKSDRKKFWMLVEGYATYAERIWFADMYPSGLRKQANNPRTMPDGVYCEGMNRVEELVKQNGQQVLLELPKRWRDF